MALALAAALSAGLASPTPSDPALAASVARGARLFAGTEALPATLSGHGAALPVAATRCIHCHARPGESLGTSSELRPPLDGRRLREIRPRRGGPAFSYDKASFCRTLRSGIDPVHVVLPRSMPHYEADDAQCGALWDYLTQGAPVE